MFKQPYVGPLKMKFTNWDTGTLYAVPDNVYVGEGNLDVLPQLPPKGRKGDEDIWGVFRLESMSDPTGTIDLWDRYTADTEITGIFWGARDVYLNQSTGGSGLRSQDIHAVDLSVAFFDDAAKNANPFPGGGIVAARTAPGAFDTFTDGTLIWTLNSVPGHDLDFPTHEVFNEFWPDGGPGGLNASGGSFAALGAVDLDGDGNATDVGTLNHMIVKDNIGPGVEFTLDFTGEPDPTQTWLVISDDPIRTEIPEPGTLAVLGLGAGLVALRRRRR